MKRVFALFALMFISATAIYAAPLKVTVSIPPQAWLVEQLGGSLVNVNTMVPAGKDPHDYAPTPQQVIGLAQSRLYFTVGMPFEKRLVTKIKGNSKCQFIDMTTGIKYRKMKGEGEEHHHHADHHEKAEHHHHHHGENGLDPHVWMSPVNLAIMAENAYKALKVVLPGDKAVLDKNYKKLSTELENLNKFVAATLKPFKGRTIFVYHPAFGYFTDLYGMEQEAIEVEGKNPTPKQLMALISEAKKDKVKMIFVQPQFNTDSARTVAKAIGGHVMSVNVLEENIPALIKKMTLEIKAGFNTK